jgi:hypothetical protein
VRIFCDDSKDDDSQLVLQSKTLLYGNSRRESFQASVHVENDLVVFRVIAQLFEGGNRIALFSIDSKEQRPHAAAQFV